MDAALLIHPGEILSEEFIQPIGLDTDEVAEMLGWSSQRVTALIAGIERITAATAAVLGQAFSTTPEFWVNLQSRYDSDVAKLTMVL